MHAGGTAGTEIALNSVFPVAFPVYPSETARERNHQDWVTYAFDVFGEGCFFRDS